jgi:hypothetical protein
MSQYNSTINKIIMNSNFNVGFYNQYDLLVVELDHTIKVEISGTYLICYDDNNSVKFFVNTITLIEGPTFSQDYIPLNVGFYQQDSAYFTRLREINDYIQDNVVKVLLRDINALIFSDGTVQTTAATGGGGSGTVTSVGFTEGNGIDITGTNPITTSGTVTITNTAPDLVVTLGEGTGIDVTGTYPNFTITNTAPNQPVSIAEGTGIDVTGTYPNFTITNTAPDLTVVLNEGTGIDITGTYPNFTIANSQDISTLVPYTGATQDVNLGVHSIIMSDGVTDTEMSPSFFGVENHAQTIFSLLTYNQLTVNNSTIASSIAVTATGITFPNATTQTTAFPPAGGTSSQYIKGDGSLATFPTIPTVGTWGALNYPTWSSGTPFVKMTAAGTFSLDTNTYLTSISSSDVTTALGYTPVPNTRTLSINGTSYDLSADRSWTISTSTSPLTTKGDIYTRNGSADARLPVGLDTQMLVADSSTTTGLKWTAQPAATPTGYYAMYQDNNTQTIAVINTGYPIKFRTMDLSNGVSVVSDSRITFANTGIYNLQFSVQLENSATQEHDVTIWIRKNGSDVAGSSGFVSVVAKHGGINGHVLPSWNYLLDVVAGEYYELVWSATSTSVTMPFYAAGSPPPSTASAIFTVTQQAGIMAGTGITAINLLTDAAQRLVTGSAGTDFDISSSGSTHTFNIPTASASNRGLLSSANWSTFNGKQDAITGAASTVTTSNLTANRAVISNASGKIATNAVTDTELGYLSGVTSAIQTQLNAKQGTLTLTTTGTSGAATLVGSTLNVPQYAGAGSGTSFQTGTFAGATVALSSTVFGTLTGGTFSGTENARVTIMPQACTISRMYFSTSTAQPASGSLVLTLRKNNADTALVITIAAGSGANFFNDTTNSVSFTAGQYASIKFQNNATLISAQAGGIALMVTI